MCLQDHCCLGEEKDAEQVGCVLTDWFDFADVSHIFIYSRQPEVLYFDKNNVQYCS